MSNAFEFVESRRGRELIFQNYSYTRFFKSNIYNCSSKKIKLCCAQVMLEDNKVLVISTDHNHLPPFLLRDENGTLKASCMMTEPKKRKGKPTLGPVASRNEVDSLVASIMKSVKEMKDRNETIVTNASEVTPEAKTRASVSKDVAPELVKIRSPETKNKNKNTPEIVKTVSIETSIKKNEPLENQTSCSLTSPSAVLLKVDNANKSELSEGKTVISQMSLAEEHLVPSEVDNEPLLKQDAGSLVPNQMYIVVPQSETGMSHNRFIIPSQNASGLMHGNRILLSPMKPDSGNLQTVQQSKINTCTSTNVPQKIDNSVGSNKMFLVLQTNNANSSTKRTNESGSLVTDNIETVIQNESGPSITNKMFFLVQKNENDSIVSTNAQPRQYDNETELSDGKSLLRNDIKTNSVSSTMHKMHPKKPEIKTSIPISSIKNLILPNNKTDTGAGLNNVKIPLKKMNISRSLVPLKKMDISRSLFSKTTLISNKSGTGYAVSSNLKPITTKKPETVPSGTNNVCVPPPKPKPCARNVVSSKMETVSPPETISSAASYVSTVPLEGHHLTNKSFTSKETQTSSGVSNKTKTIAPKTIENDNNNTQSVPQNNTEKVIAVSSKMQPIELVKIETNSIKLINAHLKTPENKETDSAIELLEVLKKTENDISSNIIRPIELNQIETDSNGYSQITPNTTETAVSSKMQEIEPKKMSSKEQPKAPKKIKTGSTMPIAMPLIDESKTEIGNIASSIMPEILPQKEETVSFMASYMKAIENMKSGYVDVKKLQASKKKVTVSVAKKINPIEIKKIKNVSALFGTPKKTETDGIVSDTTQQKTIKADKVKSFKIQQIESIKTELPAKELDFNWIISKNKKTVTPKKKETDVFPSKNTKQPIGTDFTDNMLEVPIPVAMIPLPKDDDAGPSAANETALASKEVPPLVMIERLSVKHKAGSSHMHSVPPKKRHYQF